MKNNQKEIYLAGGCFWGVEGYFQKVDGIVETTVGYANGTKENPSYEDACSGEFGFAEVAHVVFGSEQLSVEELLMHFLRIVDPYSVNRQGNDVGLQYRSGIYYADEALGEEVKQTIQRAPHAEDFVIEIEPLNNFYAAEEYHQDYLIKNPTGYCHVNLATANDSLPSSIEHFEK